MSETPTSSSSTTTTSTTSSNNNNKDASRGRGRGKRGGRGGNNQSRPAPTQPATLKQQAANISTSNSAPPNPALPVAPLPLQKLSAIMDTHFPVDCEPYAYYEPVIIDPTGAVEIAMTTYRHVTRLEPKLETNLSESEFVLCFGYVLSHRVLSVQRSLTPLDIVGMPELEDRMHALTLLPEPMAQYLEGIGLFRNPQGQTLCPQLILPRSNSTPDLIGMEPSLYDEGYTGAAVPQAFSSMFPFGLLEREIVSYNHHDEDEALTWFEQLSTDGPLAADVLLTTRPASYPYRRMIEAHPHRHRLMSRGFFSAQQPAILNSIRWNSTLFSEFLSFINKISRVISVVPYSRNTSGSPAMTAAAVPLNGNANIAPTNFDYNIFCALNKSEMHAARLFNYRVRRSVNHVCSMPDNADADWSYNHAPSSLIGLPPLRLTELRGRDLYLDHYVKYFTKL